MLADVDCSRLLFPRCLYGDAISTCGAWRTLLNRAWKVGSWAPVFAELEMIPVTSLPGAIVLYGLPLSLRRQQHWWFLWVPRFFEGEVGCIQLEEVKRRRKFVLSGMHECWFTISMLQMGNSLPQLSVGRGYKREFAAPMLCWYIHWLPEILSLYERFAFGGEGVLFRYADYPDPDWRWRSFWGYFLAFAQSTGVIAKGEQFDKLVTKANGDVVKVLIDEGVLRVASGRFVLQDTK